MPYTIYKITNSVTKKIYIGLTKGTIKNRLRNHISVAYARPDSKIRLHQAIRKHGEEAFRIRRLCERDTKAEAMELEIKMIAKYKAREFKIGYNMAIGGGVLERTPEGQARVTAALRKRKRLPFEKRAKFTAAANEAKRGMKESKESRERKSIAQSKRWAEASDEERKQHGRRSRNSKSNASIKRSVVAMQKAFSPRRQKGVKHHVVKCPHCSKEGGHPVMQRYHFDRCKFK